MCNVGGLSSAEASSFRRRRPETQLKNLMLHPGLSIASPDRLIASIRQLPRRPGSRVRNRHAARTIVDLELERTAGIGRIITFARSRRRFCTLPYRIVWLNNLGDDGQWLFRRRARPPPAMLARSELPSQLMVPPRCHTGRFRRQPRGSRSRATTTMARVTSAKGHSVHWLRPAHRVGICAKRPAMFSGCCRPSMTSVSWAYVRVRNWHASRSNRARHWFRAQITQRTSPHASNTKVPRVRMCDRDHCAPSLRTRPCVAAANIN